VISPGSPASHTHTHTKDTTKEPSKQIQYINDR
jgi:hypothetical protein